MTADEPLIDEVRAMLAHYAGPPSPSPTRRRSLSRAPRRLILALGLITLLVVASAAGARALDLFAGGQPVSDAVKSQVATGSVGAPPTLDPKIKADKTVTMITIETSQGEASLLAAPAARASYCMGITFSWLGSDPGLGCDGPGGRQLAIDSGYEIPGRVGTSPAFTYGHVRDERATTVRINLSSGAPVDLPLTSGFFLTELAPNQRPLSYEALDRNGDLIARQDLPDASLPTGLTAR